MVSPHNSYLSTLRRQNVPALFAVLALLIFALAVMTRGAAPRSTTQARIQAWVDALQEERLTPPRHNAQRELENAGEIAVPALVSALQSENPILRRNAADMLGYIASPNSLTSLRFALANDSAPEVRRNAAWALGEIIGFAATADIQRAATLDPNVSVRQAAMDSLARIRTRTALMAGVNEQDMSAYAVAPTRADVVYVAVGRDLKVTRDGGKSWTTFSNCLPDVINVLAVSPENPLMLYAGVDRSEMYRSVDGGRDWELINLGLKLAPGAGPTFAAVVIDSAKSLAL